MEKILQEFRIIETDDGFRIEIKGDKEALRDFVMSLDPRQWMRGGSHHGPHHGPFGGPRAWGPPPFPFGPGAPRFRMRFGRGFGPFGFAWGGDDAEDEDDEEQDRPRHKRGHHGRHHGRHHDHESGDEAETDEIV